MQMAETAQKDEEYFSFTPVHDAYARAAAIMMNSLDADGDWDFDSDSAKDRQRELLIYSIAKAIERQAEMNFNEGEMKLAKEQYKQVQSVLFTLMPKRQHVTSQKLKDSYERQSDHIRKKFSQGYLQGTITLARTHRTLHSSVHVCRGCQTPSLCRAGRLFPGLRRPY